MLIFFITLSSNCAGGDTYTQLWQMKEYVYFAVLDSSIRKEKKGRKKKNKWDDFLNFLGGKKDKVSWHVDFASFSAEL